MIDPEVGIDVVDLGLIREIHVDPRTGATTVDLVLTTKGCPLVDYLSEQVRRRAASLPGITWSRSGSWTSPGTGGRSSGNGGPYRRSDCSCHTRRTRSEEPPAGHPALFQAGCGFGKQIQETSALTPRRPGEAVEALPGVRDIEAFDKQVLLLQPAQGIPHGSLRQGGPLGERLLG